MHPPAQESGPPPMPPMPVCQRAPVPRAPPLRLSRLPPGLRDDSAPGQAQMLMALWRRLWALPVTALGLMLGLLAGLLGARWRVAAGVIEISGGRLAQALQRLPGWPPGLCEVEAITFGHVILGQSEAVLTRLRTHEHTHVRQYERWGLLMLPLYGLSSAVAAWQGQAPYWGNWFEREALWVAALLDRPDRSDRSEDERL